VRVSLLIPSHALPSFSYLVPERFVGEVRVGTAVVAPLSGYSRLGIVVGFEEEMGERPLKEIRAVAKRLSLPESLVRLCGWAAGAGALPPHAVLRMALPPGLETSTYEVRRPARDWPWEAGSAVGRTKLRRFLGGEGLKDAEVTGRIVFAPAPPARRTVEWAIANEEADLELLRRAPRQRALLEALVGHDRGRPVAEVLNAAGARRETLRRLIRRGAVRLEQRPEPAPVRYARGSGAGLEPYAVGAEKALSQGGDWVWQIPDAEGIRAAAAVVRAASRRGEQALVLAPEIGAVERLTEAFEGLLPAGLTVAPYHSGMGRSRAAVYEAARSGEVDALVGTRVAVFAPVARLGAICVVDEPNEAHRAPSKGYEGVPIHVRDLAWARGRIEGAAVVFLSPFPSLRLYASVSGTRRLLPVEPTRWPAVAVVDMRGTGAALSSTLLDACRRTIRAGGRVGVVVNRLGRAASVSCNRCGFVWVCPACDLPLGLHGTPYGTPAGAGFLFCGRCGHKEAVAKECPDCGSERLGGTGLTADRVRAELAGALGVEVGLLTGPRREGEEAPVVVGTSRCVFEGEWDLIVVPDADSLLFAGSVEKGFRVLYGAAEASSARLLVQTRSPEHHALRAALRGDYEAFAAKELPKRRALGYPPHAHLAEVTFEGSEEAVRRAVESRLRPALASGVELLDPVPLAGDGGRPVWRVLLRSRKRGALAEAAALVARLAARSRGRLEARINMDPEEV
jgi:primosomal protein N' (replication factor Y) (superfamily II helicase)